MSDPTRDAALLALLDAQDRHVIDEMVDEFIANELPSRAPEVLRAAAVAFDENGKSKPQVEAITAYWMAASLRLRAAQISAH